MFLAKVRCSSIMFLRTGFCFFSQLNCAFDPYFILRKTCVGSEIESFELYVTESSDLVSRWKTRCFKLHSTENMFWLIGNEIGFHELYMFAKTRSTDTKNMFWPVSRKDVLFPALLQGKKVSFQFALSHPAFHLILLERTFLLNFGQATLFQNLLSEKNLFLCFCNQTTLLMLYTTEKMLWFVGN